MQPDNDNNGSIYSRSSLMRTPFITRFIVLLILTFYIVGFKNPRLVEQLIDIPYYTYGEFQLYRAFSTYFFGLNFINLLITLYILVHSAMRLERYFGSSQLLSWILLLCITITIFHDGLSILAYIITRDSIYMFQSNHGFLGVSIALFNISTLMVRKYVCSFDVEIRF